MQLTVWQQQLVERVLDMPGAPCEGHVAQWASLMPDAVCYELMTLADMGLRVRPLWSLGLVIASNDEPY